MPFLVTTKREEERGPRGATFAYDIESRRAVATLDEARDRVYGELPEGTYSTFYNEAHALSESGGPIGPLPDGTVIEVEQTSYRWLSQYLGFPNPDEQEIEAERDAARAAILDAWNAAHA